MLKKVLRGIDFVFFSIPFFIGWPVHVWNWAAAAYHVPLHLRNYLVSTSFGAMGVVVIYCCLLVIDFFSERHAMLWIIMQLMAAYTGSGLAAVTMGIKLSRRYRPRPRLIWDNEDKAS